LNAIGQLTALKLAKRFNISIDPLKRDIASLLEKAIRERVFPCAVAGIVFEETKFFFTAGKETYDDIATPVHTNAIFDIASLTKVIATSTAVMQLVESAEISLEDYAFTFLPRLMGTRREITIKQLLAHTAGFPGPVSFYQFCHNREELLDAVFSTELAYAPGTNRIYDDISFVLLGLIVETITDAGFDQYCAEHIFRPLQMFDTMFNPSEHHDRQIIPTKIDPMRGGLLRGIVHDENACLMGGVAGHAGLFSTVDDLARFSSMMLRRISEVSSVISDASIHRMQFQQWRDSDGEYGLGWDKLRRRYMNGIDDENVIGHTGFTGTSLIVSPKRDLAVILLSNRVYPQRSDASSIMAVRRELVEIIIRHFA
jgi:serine-type D-Ala-D-Ala carboxypeptidase